MKEVFHINDKPEHYLDTHCKEKLMGPSAALGTTVTDLVTKTHATEDANLQQRSLAKRRKSKKRRPQDSLTTRILW